MLTINKRYTLTTIAPSILQGVYKNVKLIGIMNSNEAARSKFDVFTLYESVKNVITGYNLSTPVSQCQWLIFEDDSGNQTILAYEFIDTCIEVNNITFSIDFNNITVEDKNIIVTRLNELGYNDFTVTIK